MTQPPSWLSLLALDLCAQAAGWRSWGGLSNAAAAPLHGTLLPAPWAARCLWSGSVAGGSSCFPGNRLVVPGEMELVELGPWGGGSWTLGRWLLL